MLKHKDIISKNVFSLEEGKWTFVKESDWCYIGSLPINSDLPETKKRGDNYILVYKIVGSEENIVQIEAGYKYNLNKDIIVKSKVHLVFVNEKNKPIKITENILKRLKPFLSIN